MTDFVVDDEKHLQPVPRELREVAVLVEPLTIAEKALLQIHAIQQRLPWALATTGRALAAAPWCSAPGRWDCWARWRW